MWIMDSGLNTSAVKCSDTWLRFLNLWSISLQTQTSWYSQLKFLCTKFSSFFRSTGKIWRWPVRWNRWGPFLANNSWRLLRYLIVDENSLEGKLSWPPTRSWKTKWTRRWESWRLWTRMTLRLWRRGGSRWWRSNRRRNRSGWLRVMASTLRSRRRRWDLLLLWGRVLQYSYCSFIIYYQIDNKILVRSSSM